MSRKSAVAPVSVIIAAHNEERFIAEAIESVHAQTLKAAEIIVVADCCTDRTAQIAKQLGARVIRKRHRNMASSLNTAVGASTQPWIALLDGDDFWHESKLALQWRAIDLFPSAGLVSCDWVQLMDGEQTTLLARLRRDRWSASNSVRKRGVRFVDAPTGRFLPRLGLITSCVMVPRQIFSEAGLFDESFVYGQTLEFFIRALAKHSLAFVEKPLAFHRRHDRNHTNNIEGYRLSYISLINRMLKHPDQYPTGAGNAYRAQLKETFHVFERGLLKQKRYLR